MQNEPDNQLPPINSEPRQFDRIHEVEINQHVVMNLNVNDNQSEGSIDS